MGIRGLHTPKTSNARFWIGPGQWGGEKSNLAPAAPSILGLPSTSFA